MSNLELRPLTDKEIFTPSIRIERLNILRSHLGLSALSLNSVDNNFVFEQNTQPPSVGIEIEMTWTQAFEDMQGRWLESTDRPRDYLKTSPTFKEFSRQYNRNDRNLRPTLEAISSIIPRVGFIPYWEFSFLPTKDTSVIDAEVSTLYEAGILFEDIPYATHMTIANIPTKRDAYAILCALEQSGGSSADRLLLPSSSTREAWSSKGTGGLLKRAPDELKGPDTKAYELRTLITTSPEQSKRVLRLGQDLAHLSLNQPKQWLLRRDKIEKSITKLGLPIADWQSPGENAEVWRKYSTLIAD